MVSHRGKSARTLQSCIKVVLIVLLISFLVVNVECKDGKKKKFRKRMRFCPLEKRGDQCKAKRSQFKCGAFLMDLRGQKEPLRWIGALPDILYKTTARNSPKFRKTYGNMKPRHFWTKNCTEEMANQKCSKLMSSMVDLPLDTCTPTILNEKATNTMGDVLCHRAGMFAPGQSFQSFIQIGFYHSVCGSDWEPTVDEDGEHLILKEELCCKFEGNASFYFRCNGAHFNKNCV